MCLMSFFYRNKMGHEVDPAWRYGVDVDGEKSTISCNNCDKMTSGGITRLKQHLPHRECQVSKCPKVSPKLKEGMQALMGPSKRQKVVTKKRSQREYEVCRKQVFGHREVLLSNDDDGDSDLERAKRERDKA